MSERTWLSVNIKQRLLDLYIQKWRSDVDICVKFYKYKLFKTEFMFENYLIDLPDDTIYCM